MTILFICSMPVTPIPAYHVVTCPRTPQRCLWGRLQYPPCGLHSESTWMSIQSKWSLGTTGCATRSTLHTAKSEMSSCTYDPTRSRPTSYQWTTLKNRYAIINEITLYGFSVPCDFGLSHIHLTVGPLKELISADISTILTNIVW